MAGDPAASMIRRVFYEVEELTRGTSEHPRGRRRSRCRRPHFDNLKQYAARPIGTFHALPIARGKSIMKSNWIRDMGEFYGQNLFLAESSVHRRRPGQHARADRQHQDRAGEVRARRRRGSRLFRDQRHVDVQQDGLPGGVQAGRYRDCRPQLPQVAPLRHGVVGRAAAVRRSVPDDRVFDVRRGAAAHDQAGAAQSEGRGTARSRQDDYADQLHVRRPCVQHAPRDGRMPGDQAGCDFSVGRGVVRFCTLVTLPAPAHRPGRSRCAGRVAH